MGQATPAPAPCCRAPAPRCFVAPVKCFDCQGNGVFAEHSSAIVAVDPGSFATSVLEEDGSAQEFLRLRALVRTGQESSSGAPQWAANAQGDAPRFQMDFSPRLPADVLLQDLGSPSGEETNEEAWCERGDLGPLSEIYLPLDVFKPRQSSGLSAPSSPSSPQKPKDSAEESTLSSEETEVRDFGMPFQTTVPAPLGVPRLDLRPVAEAVAAQLAAQATTASESRPDPNDFAVITVYQDEVQELARRQCAEWWPGNCMSQRCARPPRSTTTLGSEGNTSQ